MADKIVRLLAEGLLIILLLSFAGIWDVLISPKWNGTPIPIFMLGVIFLLVLFAPKRWG